MGRYILFCEISEVWVNDNSLNAKYEAVIWHLNGCINGCYQPCMVVDEWCGSEIQIRVQVERKYPGIEYRLYPRMVDGEWEGL